MTKTLPVAIVSGGSKGLGIGIVKSLLAVGYFVASFSRNTTKEIQALQKGKYKAQFYWEEVNATDSVQLRDFVQNVIKERKRIDVLINNAGVGLDGILTMMSDQDISKVIDLNLHSTIKLTQLCLNPMLKQKSGCILNISSIIGQRGYSGLSVYSATKAALDGFTRALAREYGSRNIRVNSIAPGYLYTDMSSKLSETQLNQVVRRTPLSRLGTVDDVVGVVEFLLSSKAQFITGQTLTVDGGITC